MKMTIGKRIYLSILTLFGVFAIFFIVFQQYREKEYKIETLNQRLQGFNIYMEEALGVDGHNNGKTMDEYVRKHGMPNLRVTVVDTLGRVLYDNLRKDYNNISNHRERKEIREAIA